MKLSTISRATDSAKEKHRIPRTIAAVCFWLIVWQIAAIAIDERLFLVSPIEVLVLTAELFFDGAFFGTVMFSFLRIAFGFFSALAAGILLAVLSARFSIVKTLLFPLTAAVKATPVASFIILAILWFSSRNLSFIISFLMVLPIIYTNVYNGIRQVDVGLLEMAYVFDISLPRRILYIYLPKIMPFLTAACSVSLGLGFKSGIAAEVIGQPVGSIGEMLYQAKLYLDTGSLLAWTLVIIVLSVAFEKLFLLLLGKLGAYIEKRGLLYE